MDLTKEAIDKIENLACSAYGLDVEIEGRHFTARDLKPVIFEPRPSALKVSTLSGFVDYVKANRDRVDLAKAIVLVKSHAEVVLATELWGEKQERSFLIGAVVDDGLKVYPFEKFLEVESFVISLRSMFEPGGDLDKLVAYVSKVRGGKTFGLEDDGVSQTATVQSGVSGSVLKKEAAPAIVRLRPYRTFRDLEQIESEFLFRMKLADSENGVVGCALFEADGGRWRNTAVLSIRDYLLAALPEGLAVIA